jgi:hypothetical protein
VSLDTRVVDEIRRRWVQLEADLVQTGASAESAEILELTDRSIGNVIVAAEQAGLRKITDVLDVGPQTAMKGLWADKEVVLKIGGPIGSRYSLFPQAHSCIALTKQWPWPKGSPHPSVLGINRAGITTKDATFIVRPFVKAPLLANYSIPSGEDDRYNKMLLDTVARHPVVEPAPALDNNDPYLAFTSFRDGFLLPLVKRARDCLLASRYACRILTSQRAFDAAVVALSSDAKYLGLGDCGRSKAFVLLDAVAGKQSDGPRFVLFGPSGCLVPRGWDCARILVESPFMQPTVLRDCVEEAGEAQGVAPDCIWRSLGVLARIQAGLSYSQQPDTHTDALLNLSELSFTMANTRSLATPSRL